MLLLLHVASVRAVARHIAALADRCASSAALTRLLSPVSTRTRTNAARCSDGKHAFMWDVVEIMRKLLLTSLVIFFDTGSPVQVAFALLVSAWAHVLHALYRPFVNKTVYYLQHGSLGITSESMWRVQELVRACVYRAECRCNGLWSSLTPIAM